MSKTKRCYSWSATCDGRLGVLDYDDPDVMLEMRAGTLQGIPNIDRLVLELNIASKESERDRLEAKCLNYIEVFEFDEADDDAEDDDEDSKRMSGKAFLS